MGETAGDDCCNNSPAFAVLPHQYFRTAPCTAPAASDTLKRKQYKNFQSIVIRVLCYNTLCTKFCICLEKCSYTGNKRTCVSPVLAGYPPILIAQNTDNVFSSIDTAPSELKQFTPSVTALSRPIMSLPMVPPDPLSKPEPPILQVAQINLPGTAKQNMPQG